MNSAEYVYLMTDDQGGFVYVGYTRSITSRMRGHFEKSWFFGVANIRLKKYPSRTRALEAERRFIRRFRPKHNIVYNPDHGFSRVIKKQKSSAEAALAVGCIWDNEDGGVNICITADDLGGDVTIIEDFFVTDSVDRLLHMAKIPHSRIATHAGYVIDDDLEAKLLGLGCEICPEISKEPKP